MLTGSRGSTNPDGSNVIDGPVLNLLVDDCSVVEGSASSLCSSPSYEGLGTSLIMADEVVDASKIDPSRKGQSHRRPVHQHWVGSDGESKKERGQQGCWEHIWEPNFLLSVPPYIFILRSNGRSTQSASFRLRTRQRESRQAAPHLQKRPWN